MWGVVSEVRTRYEQDMSVASLDTSSAISNTVGSRLPGLSRPMPFSFYT